MRRWFLVGFVLLAAAAWLLGWSPYLRATSVSVDGATTIPVQHIISTSGVTVGTPLARVNGARVERALTSIPRIASVNVVRGWPNRITLRIRERAPIALVGALGVDRQGVRFPLAANETPPAVRINNFTPERFRQWLDISERLPRSLQKQIIEVSLDGNDDIWFKTADLMVIWGSSEDSAVKVRVLNELLARPSTFTRIDVSAPLAPTTVR